MAQLKDLIVHGPARFLNNLYGNLIGNATSSDKVNHTLTIMGTSFNGSANVTINENNFKLESACRLMGEVDSALLTIEDGVDVTITDGSKAIIPLVEFFGNSGLQTGTISGTANKLYYFPKIGDIVLQGNEEYMCVEVKATTSKWRCLDSTAYWGTW